MEPRALLAPALTGVVLLALFQFLFPLAPRIDSDFPTLGEISDREIRAPFAMTAPLLERDVEMRQLQQVLVEPPVVRRQPGAQVRTAERFGDWRDALLMHAGLADVPSGERLDLMAMRFPELPQEDMARALELDDPVGRLEAVEAALAELQAVGVVDNLPPGNYTKIRILEGGGEVTVDLPRVTLQAELTSRLAEILGGHGLPADEAAWLARLVRPLVASDLVYSADETEERRALARRAVPTQREFIMGERLVGRGDRVTEQEALFLSTLHGRLVEKGSIGPVEKIFWRSVTRLLLAAAMLLIFGWVAWIHFRELLLGLRRLFAAAAVFAVFLVGAAVSLSQPSFGAAAVPVPLLAILLTVLFRERVGYPVTLLALALLGLAGADRDWMLAWAVLGLVSVALVRRIRQRDQFYKAIAVLSALQVFLITVVNATQGVSLLGLGSAYFAGVLTPVASIALALFLLPVIEPLVGVSSDLTLLELSDLNHPLLKRMALESQGTFHHCQVVAQIAENAARSIGANSLLTRVGALFHDIGKMSKPEYYVENQGGGPNKHDELSPSMSALVVASHVREGIEMARRWRLPQAVIDFIPEHHGTSVMKYFYHKALENDEQETVKVDDFRYPGPKPQSRETAILMLADAVEAATRSLAKPTPGRIREMTKQIIDERMLSGELDECQLSLNHLARIREAFIPLLTGIHHARILYPGQRGGDAVGDAGGES